MDKTQSSNNTDSKLKIASTLAWILGILNVLGGLSFLMPALAGKVPIVYPIRILILATALCIAGYGLRQRKKYAGYIAILAGLVAFGSPPVVGFLLGLSLIILTIMNWKALS